MANEKSCIKISYKKIKFARIKISKQSEIFVSVPVSWSSLKTQEFIKNNQEWIEKTLSKIPKLKDNEVKFFGNLIKINFDENEKIITNLGEINFNQLKENLLNNVKIIEIFVKNNQNFINLKNSLLKEICMDFINKFSQITGLYPKKISFNNAKTRYGSCNFALQKINFSFLLSQRNLHEIAYVVLHEISHLKYPNHKRDFYNFIETFMPNFMEFHKSLRKF